MSIELYCHHQGKFRYLFLEKKTSFFTSYTRSLQFVELKFLRMFVCLLVCSNKNFPIDENVIRGTHIFLLHLTFSHSKV